MKLSRLAAIALCAASLCFSQAVDGTLLGTITDASGAAVPNAKVQITETNTGIGRSGLSGQAGNYVFPNLVPGTYTVSVEQQGFRKAVRSNVIVLVNSTIRADLELQPGSVTEVVNIVASSELLQTDRSDTGRKIETRQIADLPLGFNRNFQNLLNLVPGTTRAFRPHSEFFNSQDSLSTQVNGQSRLSNNLQFEGVDNNHRTGLLQVLIPPVEALQTVDITTSNYEAELGRAGGAVTNIQLKSGTNEFHGSGYEFNRVSALAARSFFQSVKPITTYNYFGGTFGGPIRKNRTFFFGDILRITDYRGQGNRFQIPTADFRSGNFSGGPTIIYDPNTGNPDGTARTPFAGQQIPDSRISSFSKKILALVPGTNLPGYGTNFDKNTTLVKTTSSFDVKIDHNHSEKDRISGRYSFTRPVVVDPPIFGLAGGPHGGGFQGTGINKTQAGAINYNRILSPTLLTEVRAGVSRYLNTAQASDYGTNASEALGVKGVNIDPWASGLFSVSIGNGYSSPMVGYSASLPWIRSETNFNIVNTWTKMVGSHTVKWGADIRRVRDDLLQTQTFNPRGVFNYGNAQTACNGCAGSPGSGFANSFASFLLDVPSSIGRDLPVVFPAWRQTQFFFFGQDKWQLTSKLTLDLGLRWEYYGPATPRFAGGFSNYDPGNNSLVLAGIGSNPIDIGMQKNKKNFAPRLGVAYRLNNKTVIRSGFGISFVPFADNTYAYNYPVKQNNSYNSTTSFGRALLPNGQPANMASGFPAPQVVAIPTNGIISPAPLNQAYDVINKKFREGYVESWNLAVQRTLPKQFTFEAAYVANHGVAIPTVYNLNAGLVPGAGANGRPLFQAFARNQDTNMRFVGTSSNFHSLQLKLDRRFAGFLLTTAYTYGKAMGIGDDNGGYSYYVNPHRSYVRQGFDRTQTFVQSYVYDLPFGKGRGHLTTGPAAMLLGGWQINGVLSLISGGPLNFNAPGASLNLPNSPQSPNITGPVNVLRGIDNALWFDTSNFSAPVGATFGNIGRNIGRGPGFFNLDASLFRTLRITERFKLELRAESFSVTNTPQFNNPDTGFGNANFGKVKGAGGNRGVQLGAKLNF
ncbi:MAG: TonB-dependent receptor [Candidatus Solibacter usitatus]|nr:TonB-dependent receptor [Candidatus Solibacter usitatus]